ncbi:MAG: TSUP family transporter [Candidatus Aminicenantes bacterium]|nr:TSUP family transporter [Candidatus Aminicenantes bacterium]
MDFPVEYLDALLAFFITTLGATLQGSIGFGLGLISVPLLVLLDPKFVPGPVLLAALCLTLLLAYREHHAINFREIGWAIAGRALGSMLGALVLLLIPREDISLWVGIMVLLAILMSAVGLSLPLNRSSLVGAGIFSGLMGTTSAIGGAPMALVYQHQKGPRLRGSLSSIFVFGTIIGIVTLIIIGRFGRTELQLALVLFPGIFLGYFLSCRTSKILDKGFIRPAVLLAAAASGLVVILRYLSAV